MSSFDETGRPLTMNIMNSGVARLNSGFEIKPLILIASFSGLSVPSAPDALSARDALSAPDALSVLSVSPASSSATGIIRRDISGPRTSETAFFSVDPGLEMIFLPLLISVIESDSFARMSSPTIRTICASSVASLFRYFFRTGTEQNRSLT